MPRDINGTYTAPASTVNPAVTGTLISSADFNSLLVDLSAALTQSIAANGVTPITADIPFSGKGVTGIRYAVASAEATRFEQIPGVSPEFSNASITASVAANALTIALKGNDGNDPSSTNVAILNYRSPTATDGKTVQRAVQTALSLVISNGSTLGVATPSVPFSLWVVMFDDSVTQRLPSSQSVTPGSASWPKPKDCGKRASTL